MVTDINWAGTLNPRDRQKFVDHLKEGSLDYLDIMTLDQAEMMEVKISGQLRTLKWVTKHAPRRLELFLDTMAPGSVLFAAITLVYNANVDRILTAVQKENGRIRHLGIEGLAARHNTAPRLRVRPVTARREPPHRQRLFLKP